MKFLPTVQGASANIWRIAFFMAFFLFAFSSLQAQNYVSSSVAKSRLASKVHQLEQQVEQGSITQLDYKINNKMIKVVLDKIQNQDFTWSTENNGKISQIFGDMLDAAQTSTLQDFPQNASKINTVKQELDTLMRQ